MKLPELEISGLKKTKLREHAVRFLFGGVVTAATGLVAHHWGPWIGGYFLAFPAILSASLTLVESHDGRRQAREDARGARLGAVGLAAFAGAVVLLAGREPPVVVFAVALLAWSAVSFGAWLIASARTT